MVKKDWDYIARLEKAIKKKYGVDTIINPKSGWTDEKEKEYLKQIKEFYDQKNERDKEAEKIQKDGFFLPKNLINKKSNRNCPVCDIYSFSAKDNFYMNKYKCCFMCFIQWVEGREDRWKKGWRPNGNKD